MEPLYKVGDEVEVIARDIESNYRFGFADGMTKYIGQIVTIVSIRRPVTPPPHGKAVPDDGYCYTILEDGNNYSWASSMFRPLPASTMFQSNDTPITIKNKVRTNKPKFNFKN